MLIACLCASLAQARDGRLGFTVDLTADRTLLDAKLKRLVVTNVAPASPAENAGLKVGDVLEQLNGEPVAGSSGRKFFSTMGKVKPGNKVVLTVRREDKSLRLTLIAE